MSGEIIHSLCAAYAVDALDDEERQRFEAHLDVCSECRHELADLQSATTALAGLTEETPPPELRVSVLDAIGRVRPLPPLERPADAAAVAGTDLPGTGARPAPDTEATTTVTPLARRRPLPVGWIAAAAAAVVLVVGLIAWNPLDRGDRGTRLTAAEEISRASDARRVEGSVAGHDATLVVSDDLDRTALFSDDMPPAPKGHDYQLWYFRSGQAASAGVMPDSEATSQAVVLKGRLGNADAVAVTVEPDGGSKRPTTAPVATFEIE